MGFKIRDGVLEKYTEEKGVTEAVIPEGVTSIGAGAFRCCRSFTSITIPDSVTSIDEFAFERCKELESINVSKNNRIYCSVDGVVYNKDKTKLILCPAGRKNLENIPDTVISFKERAFQGYINSIALPDNLSGIGERSFINYHLNTVILGSKGELKIDVDEIRKTGESVPDAWKMLFTKDFERKFSHKVKFKLIADYFFVTEDEAAKEYLKKNFAKVIKQIIDENDIERLTNIIKKTDFLTKNNIDKHIKYAIENTEKGGNPKLQVALMNYKHENFGMDDSF